MEVRLESASQFVASHFPLVLTQLFVHLRLTLSALLCQSVIAQDTSLAGLCERGVDLNEC